VKRSLCLLAFLLCCGVEGWASFSFVQKTDSSANSCQLTGVSSSNFLVYLVTISSGSGTLNSISDGTDTWTIDVAAPNDTSVNESGVIAHNFSPSAGTHSLTANITGNFTHCYLLEFSMTSGVAVDITNSDHGTAANPSVNLSVAGAGEMLVAVTVSHSPPSVGSGFTLMATQGSNWYELGEYNLSSGSGTVSAGIVMTSDGYDIAAIAFKASGGGSTPTCKRKRLGVGC
jgi:hypothetical protein